MRVTAEAHPSYPDDPGILCAGRWRDQPNRPADRRSFWVTHLRSRRRRPSHGTWHSRTPPDISAGAAPRAQSSVLRGVKLVTLKRSFLTGSVLGPATGFHRVHRDRPLAKTSVSGNHHGRCRRTSRLRPSRLRETSEIELDPLRAALVRPPGEPGNLLVVGVPRHQAVGCARSCRFIAVRGTDLEKRLGAAVSAQVCASGPSPITGKAEIRSRAAPMGMSVTVSIGWSDFTGLG